MVSAFLLCVSFEMMGFCGGERRLPVFPKVDALRARVDGAAGPLALGCQGSACDRLRLTGGLRAPALGSYYSIAALARYGAFGAISYAAFGG